MRRDLPLFVVVRCSRVPFVIIVPVWIVDSRRFRSHELFLCSTRSSSLEDQLLLTFNRVDNAPPLRADVSRVDEYPSLTIQKLDSRTPLYIDHLSLFFVL